MLRVNFLTTIIAVIHTRIDAFNWRMMVGNDLALW